MNKQGGKGLSLVSPHLQPVAQAIMLRQHLCLLIDMEGEVSLHTKGDSSKWQHLSTQKLFACPVVATDHVQSGSAVKVVLVGFDRSMKIFKVSQSNEILHCGSFYLSILEQPVVDCTWNKELTHVILATEKGAIFEYNLTQQEMQSAIEMAPRGPMRLQRSYEGAVYASCGSYICRISKSMEGEMSADLIFELSKEGRSIDDFILSRDKFYNHLAILSGNQLIFYDFNDLSEPSQKFEVDSEAISHSVSWGRSFEEVCLHSQGSPRILSVFRCDWNGRWQLYIQ